jgi:hypothetical protein
MQKFRPNPDDPKRKWSDLGGDIEGSYDGAVYVDIRHKTTHKRLVFISKSALKKALALFVESV